MGGRDGQVEREFSREVAVGDPTHTVGAEETAHDRVEARSALAVLRSLAGLLETSLLALLDARVAGQHARLLERRPRSLGVSSVERTGDAETQSAGLTRHAATVDARDDVVRPGHSRGLQRLGGDLLVHLVREVVLKRAAIDGPGAGARDQPDA